MVEILDADAVELSVPAEQREQLELTGRALHLPVELAHGVEDQAALVVRANDVALRVVVTVPREGERTVAAHVVHTGREVRTRVRVVHRSS